MHPKNATLDATAPLFIWVHVQSHCEASDVYKASACAVRSSVNFVHKQCSGAGETGSGRRSVVTSAILRGKQQLRRDAASAFRNLEAVVCKEAV